MYDDDPWAEQEAIEQERFDADLEQAEMERAGAAIWAAKQRGICTHSGAVSYLDPPLYPEQVGLRPGQLRCTDGCNRLFDSEEDWFAAMEEAIYG